MLGVLRTTRRRAEFGDDPAVVRDAHALAIGRMRQMDRQLPAQRVMLASVIARARIDVQAERTDCCPVSGAHRPCACHPADARLRRGREELERLLANPPAAAAASAPSSSRVSDVRFPACHFPSKSATASATAPAASSAASPARTVTAARATARSTVAATAPSCRRPKSSSQARPERRPRESTLNGCAPTCRPIAAPARYPWPKSGSCVSSCAGHNRQGVVNESFVR